MARKYYTATQGTVSTTGSANGVNVSFRPEASKNYAIFHNLIQGYSAGDQTSTIKLVGIEPFINAYPNGTTAPEGPPGVANVANGSAIANLTEYFSGTSINTTNWLILGNGSGSNVYISGDALKLKPRALVYSILPGLGSPTGIGIQSARKFNIRSSSITFESTANAVAMATGAEENLQLGIKRADATDDANAIWFTVYYASGSATLRDIETKTGSSQISSSSYSPTNHRWMKMSESGGTITFYTSSDGNNWSTFGSTKALSTTGLESNATLCQIFISARNYGSVYQASQLFSVENINHLAVAGEPGAGGVNANGVNIAAFSETFTGGANTTLWIKVNEGTTPNLVYANGRLELKARNLGNYPRLISKNRYNLQSSSVTIEMPSMGTPDNYSQEIEFRLNSSTDDSATQNSIKWMVTGDSVDNRMRLYHNASMIKDTTSGTWSSTGTKFYRIAEQGGTIYWFKSANTTVWEQTDSISLGSYPNINVKNLRIEMSAWCWDGDSLNTIAFDNFNMLVKQDNNVITFSETNFSNEYLNDKHWNGGVTVYTAPTDVIGNTNVIVQAVATGGTLSLYDQSLTILELTANDKFSTNNVANARSFMGTSGNGHSVYRTAEAIEIPAGEYIIIGSASITDNKAVPSAANNIRMTVFDDTEKVSYGYRDSIHKQAASEYVPYWYVGTHSLDNTRTYKLLYHTPSATYANVKSSTILALSQNDFAETISKHEEVWSSTTSGSYTNIVSYTFTPKFSTNYLLLSTWSTGYGSTDSTFSQFLIDDVSVYGTTPRQRAASPAGLGTWTLTTNSPNGSKFTNGYIGVQAFTQTTKSANIQAYSQTSGQTSWIGRKNITAIALGDKELISDLYVKTNDTWNQTAPYVKVDGNWKSFTPSYKVGGTWRTASVTEYSYEYAATQNTYFAIDASSTGATVSIRGSTYAKDTYVVTGHGGLINTSTDGVTWTARTSGTTTTIYSITYGDGYFVASNAGGFTATSIDAATWGTWSIYAPSSSNNAVKVSYLNGVYLLGTTNGNILTSTNGATWTYRKQSLFTGGINGFVYAEGLHVAAGSGQVWTSDDNGVNWTSRTSNASGSINDIAYGKDTGKFVYVTDNGGIGTSTDAITWSFTSAVTSTALYKVGYGNGLYVATGAAGLVLSSTDATTWDVVTTGSASNHSALTYVEGRGEFLIGGQGGSILRHYRVNGSEDYSNKFV